MTSLLHVIFDRNYYRESFIAITILFTISFFTPFSTILNLLLLIWGGVLILKDIFTKRIIFSSKRFIPLIIFMIFYFATLIINRGLNLFENVKIFTLTALQFFILFAFDSNEEVEETSYNIKKFNNIIIYMTFVSTSISLLVYLFGIGFEINGHVVGVQSGMLNGIYTGSNTAGPLAAISIAVTIINHHLSEKERLNKFNYANLIIQLIFLYMTNSRAALYCFLVFAMIFSAFYFKGIKNKFIAFIGTGIIFFLSKIVNNVIYLLQKGIKIICNAVIFLFEKSKEYISNLTGNEGISHSLEENIIPQVSQVVEKEISMGFLNGRAQLWKCGAKIIKDNLWFGIGSRNVYDVALKYDNISNLPGIEGGGMHNIIMQVIVSNGILGFLALVIFIVPIIFIYFKYLICSKLKSKRSKTVLLISSLLIMLLVNNMAEANIFYSATYMATVFWTYLGFGLFLIDNDSRGETSD